MRMCLEPYHGHENGASRFPRPLQPASGRRRLATGRGLEKPGFTAFLSLPWDVSALPRAGAWGNLVSPYSRSAPFTENVGDKAPNDDAPEIDQPIEEGNGRAQMLINPEEGEHHGDRTFHDPEAGRGDRQRGQQ